MIPELSEDYKSQPTVNIYIKILHVYFYVHFCNCNLQYVLDIIAYNVTSIRTTMFHIE